jgi:hypothetical protein
MQLIVMENTPPEGWTTSNYKTFKSDDQDSDSDSEDESDTDSEKSTIRGYKKEKYQKILVEEELLPE